MVYLDYNATTPLDAQVLDAMLPWLSGHFGNPSSLHSPGRRAREAIEEARMKVAGAVGAAPTEVFFCASGTEANNLFLKGAAAQFAAPGALLIGATEHSSVDEPARQLAKQGWTLREMLPPPLCFVGSVPPPQPSPAGGGSRRGSGPGFPLPPAGGGREGGQAWGQIDIASFMLAHNETGVLHDIACLALALRERSPGLWFHSDAVQALGKIPLDFRALKAAGVTAISLGAHKIGGPPGAAALVLDKRRELPPLIAGGGQERGRRGGTENVAALVGFGRACELAVARLADEARRLAALRDALEATLVSMGAMVFGADASRLANTSFFAFPGIDGATLVAQLDAAGFAVGSGSACSSAQPGSRSLRALGVPEALARGAIRLSLGKTTTAKQINDFLSVIQVNLSQLRTLTSLST
ncbi:MAG: cysteine desulfurase [Zoogloeaceae bacterium]|jgi:cysteine desulfurase|nr:cysteine desulfurase [Zoogloeaceae bacterium]